MKPRIVAGLALSMALFAASTAPAAALNLGSAVNDDAAHIMAIVTVDDANHTRLSVVLDNTTAMSFAACMTMAKLMAELRDKAAEESLGIISHLSGENVIEVKFACVLSLRAVKEVSGWRPRTITCSYCRRAPHRAESRTCPPCLVRRA
jgi:hypothetical protein